jgi:hypothetical protein
VSYRYHFAYNCGVVGGGIGFGNYAATLDQPIRGREDLNRIVEAIRANNPGNTTVVILSWQRFEDGAQ